MFMAMVTFITFLILKIIIIYSLLIIYLSWTRNKTEIFLPIIYYDYLFDYEII